MVFCSRTSGFYFRGITEREGKLAVRRSPTALILTESSIMSVSLIFMLTEPFSEDCRNSSIVVFGVMFGCALEKLMEAAASALSDLQMSIRSLMDRVGG
jgi:Na+/H+-dicarboxylate symporter